jgi:signal peptidase I
MLVQTDTPPVAQPLRIPAAPRGVADRRPGVADRRPGVVHRRPGVAQLVSSSLLCGVVLLIMVAIVGMVLGAWRFTVIDTGSMRPTLNPGDVAILTPERSAALKPGQIVAFHPPGEPRLTVVHRVFSIKRIHDGVVIQTKGDANNATDSWHARIVGNTVWRERLKAPKLGYLSVWSQQRPVRFGLLIAIVVLVVITLLGSIWRPVRREGPTGGDD